MEDVKITGKPDSDGNSYGLRIGNGTGSISPKVVIREMCIRDSHKIAGIGAYFGNMFLVSPVMLGSTIIIIYGLNFIVGLLPVFRVIRKTPAAILSRTDI